jgi:hypothetical protein
MNYISKLGLLLAIALLGIAAVWGSAQSDAPQATPKPTVEQQKQLDRLRQLGEQLQKDRDALHQAITQHGWESDEVDAAEDGLFRDREEYRKLRRSLRAAGVTVPPASGFGPGTGAPGPGARPGRGSGGGPHPDCPYMPDCPCARR